MNQMDNILILQTNIPQFAIRLLQGGREESRQTRSLVGGEFLSPCNAMKFETQIDTINARHSPKYFGLGKGVTAYTLVANNVPVNADHRRK